MRICHACRKENARGSAMEFLTRINDFLSALFCACFTYQIIYLAVALLKRPKPLPPAVPRRYAAILCARNEEAVIGNLIESIHAQKYPGGLVDVYVCADNCTDGTAAVARARGAIVFERFDSMRIGKGYALDFLFERLRASGVFARYDGFFFFDADNLLHEDFIAEMNKSFAAGNRIVTSYRNSKNYGDNWISAGYSLWFLRDAQYMNNPRMQLKTSSVVGGTGFLVAREVIEKNGGWPFHLLTEDTEFTIDSVLSGEFIAYCGNAILYDEQPTSFRQSWRQRLRWSRGYLQVLRKYGVRLVSGVFRGGKRGYACFDMLMAILPAIVLTLACALLNAGGALYSLIVLREPVLGTLCGELLRWFGGMYVTLLATGAVTLASEWKRIYCSSFRKVFFLFTFPLFMMTYLPVSVAALFQKAEWKPIRHSVSKTLADLRDAA